MGPGRFNRACFCPVADTSCSCCSLALAGGKREQVQEYRSSCTRKFEDPKEMANTNPYTRHPEKTKILGMFCRPWSKQLPSRTRDRDMMTSAGWKGIRMMSLCRGRDRGRVGQRDWGRGAGRIVTPARRGFAARMPHLGQVGRDLGRIVVRAYMSPQNKGQAARRSGIPASRKVRASTPRRQQVVVWRFRGVVRPAARGPQAG